MPIQPFCIDWRIMGPLVRRQSTGADVASRPSQSRTLVRCPREESNLRTRFWTMLAYRCSLYGVRQRFVRASWLCIRDRSVDSVSPLVGVPRQESNLRHTV